MEEKNRFKLARKQYNQHGTESVKIVSEATGITKSLIDDLESNILKKRETSYIKVATLAKHYGVSVDYLVGLSDVPSIDDKVKVACEYIGLSMRAVQNLHDFMESQYHPLTKKWCDFLFTSDTFVELSCGLASYATASLQSIAEKWKEEKNEKASGVRIVSIGNSPSESEKGSAGWRLLKCAYAMTDSVDDSFKDGIYDYITEIPINIIGSGEEFEEFNTYVKGGGK